VGLAHRGVESMKGSHTVLLFACLLVVGGPVFAATLTNNDGQSYVVEANVDGQIYELTVLDGATIALCDYGCEVRLVKTGQTITVQPNDSVVIDDGVMSVSD
jgi:hypothetical protein